MSYPRCESPSDSCPRARRWSFKLHTWLWVCECGKAYRENADGTPSSTPLRSDPDPSVGCPICGAPMALVTGRKGDFWSCARYPACKGTRPITPAITTEGETPS